MKKYAVGFVCSCAVAFAPSAHAQDADGGNKWGPHIDLEGKAGTDRNLGETDLFIPLWQDDDTLAFANIRARMDDANSHEGNFGVGIRQMLDSGWAILIAAIARMTTNSIR
jgi:hypothetical protein